MNQPRQLDEIIRITVGVAAAISVLLGCEASPPPAEPIDRGVVFVEPDLPESAREEIAARSAPVRWLIRQTAIRLGTPTGDLWELTDESILPPISQAVWNGNGLRIGLLSASDAGDLADAFGEVIEIRDSQTVSFGYLDVLRESPPLSADFVADLTVPPGEVYKETFTNGRLRLLMSSKPLGNGVARLTLTPQHFRAKPSLQPRSPIEKIQDGRVFHELELEVDVRGDEAILLGLYRPTDVPTEDPEENAPTESGDPPTTADSDRPVSRRLPTGRDEAAPSADDPDAESDPLADDLSEPPNLGQGLWTTGVGKNDLQLFLLLRPLSN